MADLLALRPGPVERRRHQPVDVPGTAVSAERDDRVAVGREALLERLPRPVSPPPAVPDARPDRAGGVDAITLLDLDEALAGRGGPGRRPGGDGGSCGRGVHGGAPRADMGRNA